MALLDVCCGPGYSAGEAAARGCTATGIDIAEGMIAEARTRFPGITFRIGDAEALELPDASVDAVVCGFGILHLPEPERALAEAFRVLRPGGRYAWTVWCGPDKAELSGIAQAAIAQYADTSVALPQAPPRDQFSDLESARAALERAGFTDVRSEELPLMFHAQTPDEVWDWYDRGTVRTAALLNLQTPAAREKYPGGNRGGRAALCGRRWPHGSELRGHARRPKAGRVIGGFIARAVALASRAVVGAAANAVATELKKPETQQKLAASAQQVAAHLRDPETLKKIETGAGKMRDTGARALGRAIGDLRNRL